MGDSTCVGACANAEIGPNSWVGTGKTRRRENKTCAEFRVDACAQKILSFNCLDVNHKVTDSGERQYNSSA